MAARFQCAQNICQISFTFCSVHKLQVLFRGSKRGRVKEQGFSTSDSLRAHFFVKVCTVHHIIFQIVRHFFFNSFMVVLDADLTDNIYMTCMTYCV